ARARAAAPLVLEAHPRHEQSRLRPVLRPAEAPRLRHGAHARARDRAARRAHGRPESDHHPEPRRAHPRAERAWLHVLRDRAQHGSRDVALPAHRRAEPGREDRRGRAVGDPRQSPCHGRVLRDVSVSLLEIRDLHAGYGRMEILKGVTVTIEPGQIASIIGPNGAGKSTVFKTIVGLLPARERSVTVEGQDVTNRTPGDLLHRSLAYVPHGRHVFPLMTVE